MYKRVTKKLILEGCKIAYTKGYWSNEIREFTEQFEVSANNKINSILNSIYNSCFPESSQYYNLALENGYIGGDKNNRQLSSKEQQKADKEFIDKEYEKIKNKLSACTRENIIDIMCK